MMGHELAEINLGQQSVHKETSKEVISIENLNVFRNGTQILKDVDLRINSGDYVGIVGPNGGGKTTLLMALLGNLARKSGTIKLFGTDIQKFTDWHRIAYVSQDAINFDNSFPVTVRELVSLGRLGRGRPGRRFKKEDWDKVEEVLEFMGLTGMARKRVGQLSGGQKQRVFIAKALVRSPELLLLDEPVAGVDAQNQEQFHKLLSVLNSQKGTTILLVSHDLAVVFCRMSKVVCVNRDVHSSELTPDLDPESFLRQGYGEHFHFVFHKHDCEADFSKQEVTINGGLK